jgi:NTP pyrophosphatase (non-canonical NTP hydrolase)
MTTTLNDYQKDAMAFRMATATPTYALLNLSGEVGELHSLVAKGIRDGRKEDFHKQLVKELGDILWCLSAVAMDNGVTLADVAHANIDKLAGRAVRGTLEGSGDDR